MSVQQEIDVLRAEIKQRVERIKLIRKHAAVLEKLEGIPSPMWMGGQLDFDHLTHKQVVKVIRVLGGKWKKTPGTSDTINYEGMLGDMPVRCYQGQPPPSCRVVEVEELVPEQIIPASVRKVRKIVCAPSLAATIAQVREPIPAPCQPLLPETAVSTTEG